MYTINRMITSLFFPKELDENKWVKCDGRIIDKKEYYDFFQENDIEEEQFQIPMLPYTFMKVFY